MLTFSSASNGLVDTRTAIQEAIASAAAAAGADAASCRLVVCHLTMGHDDRVVPSAIRACCPHARVVGCTGAGVIGREGANESMRAVAVMLVWGAEDELSVATTRSLTGHTAAGQAAALAHSVQSSHGTPQFAMFLGSGLDTNIAQVLHGVQQVWGPEPHVFGATAADNMRGIADYQFLDDEVLAQGAALIGFHDPTLRVATQASHGFVPLGVELTVTRAEGHRIFEFDGEPAWVAYTRALGLPAGATTQDTIPQGALGAALSADDAREYGDSHILQAVNHRLDDNSVLTPTQCTEGTTLTLMRRDEDRIFANLDIMMAQLRGRVAGGTVAAVFHADCGARGRLTLDRIAKEEIVERMQAPLRHNGHTPPWLGVYGFGEIARLRGRDRFHNYTTSLAVLIRSAEPPQS